MRDLIAAVLASTLLACASPHEQPPYATAWATSDVGDVEMAAWEWDKRVVPSKHIACDIPVCWIGDELWHLAKQELGGPDGETWHVAEVIDFEIGLSVARQYSVSLHEFGHALGLGHTSTGLMTPGAETDDFTPDVLAECRRVGSCP